MFGNRKNQLNKMFYCVKKPEFHGGFGNLRDAGGRGHNDSAVCPDPEGE